MTCKAVAITCRTWTPRGHPRPISARQARRTVSSRHPPCVAAVLAEISAGKALPAALLQSLVQAAFCDPVGDRVDISLSDRAGLSGLVGRCSEACTARRFCLQASA